MKIQDKTIINRSTDVIFSEIDGEFVFLSIEKEEYYYLNSVGSEIWKYISEPRRVTDIIEFLSESYIVTKEACMSETVEYLTELFELGIIYLSNA